MEQPLNFNCLEMLLAFSFQFFTHLTAVSELKVGRNNCVNKLDSMRTNDCSTIRTHLGSQYDNQAVKNYIAYIGCSGSLVSMVKTF